MRHTSTTFGALFVLHAAYVLLMLITFWRGGAAPLIVTTTRQYRYVVRTIQRGINLAIASSRSAIR
jgi:hypothetical protein